MPLTQLTTVPIDQRRPLSIQTGFCRRYSHAVPEETTGAELATPTHRVQTGGVLDQWRPSACQDREWITSPSIAKPALAATH